MGKSTGELPVGESSEMPGSPGWDFVSGGLEHPADAIAATTTTDTSRTVFRWNHVIGAFSI
jgi:hypothetical protein